MFSKKNSIERWDSYLVGLIGEHQTKFYQKRNEFWPISFMDFWDDAFENTLGINKVEVGDQIL